MAKKSEQIYTVECHQCGSFHHKSRYYYQTGTLAELIKAYKYTLECGQSWEREKGNKKINTNPKTILQLIRNLNNAKNNSAANGYSGTFYKVVDKPR